MFIYLKTGNKFSDMLIKCIYREKSWWRGDMLEEQALLHLKGPLLSHFAQMKNQGNLPVLKPSD